MANVKKLLSQFEEANGEELEQLSAEEAENIEGGAAALDLGCKHNTGCGPNTSCGPTPTPTPTPPAA